MVSLTYDGTLPCHAETALPHLDHFGLKATFYADPVPLLDDLPIWRRAVETGHEIGNGCLMGSLDGGSVLAAWTPEMVGDDIDETDSLLRELFAGQTGHSMGFPWVTGTDTHLADVKAMVARRNSIARSGVAGLNPMDSPDVSYLKCLHMDGLEAGHMTELVRAAVRSHSWIVLSFDGVGSGDRAVDSAEHKGLCAWLADNPGPFRVETILGAASGFNSAFRPTLRLV